MFKKGDLVRLKRGWTKMIVVKVNYNLISAIYVPENLSVSKSEEENCKHFATTRWYTHFVHWDGPVNAFRTSNKPHHTKQVYHEYPHKPILESMRDMKYKFTHNGELWLTGTKQGVTTAGLFIIETSDEKVHLVPPESAVEVVPYTVLLENCHTSHNHHVCIPEGSVKIGSLLTCDGKFYRVRRLDTKARGVPIFNGHRLVVEDL